ncbi:MAG: Na+/H+ antiporter subunit E [Desulfobacteraceae bacterium]|jgi:multicomponent Na+:H+ antiporter subunit E|nr:Na+/H+ antiporter subunit E [Desulfobacteraceae bacterium]
MMVENNKPGQGERPRKPDSSNAAQNGVQKKRFVPILLTFIISMVTWLVLSGQFDRFHISLGVVSSFIVAYFSGDLLFAKPINKVFPRQVMRFILYVPWLLYQVFIANLHILKIVFHPKMMDRIDPKIIRFKSNLSGQMPLFIFGNSITLTPGTVTIFVNVFGTYTVHAIDEKSAEGLPGEMENRIVRIFED